MIKSMLTIKDPVERLNYAKEITKTANHLLDKFIYEFDRCTRELSFTDQDFAELNSAIEEFIESDFSFFRHCFYVWCDRLEKKVTVHLLEETFGTPKEQSK